MIIYRNSFERFLEIIIIYACLFPNVSFGLNSMDSQPWVLILVFIYLLQKMKFEKKSIFTLWLFSIFATISSIFYIMDNQYLDFVQLMRAISNYTIVFFIWAFSINIHKKYNPIKHYIFASWIYIIYSLLQIFGYSFLDWVSPHRTAMNRGVTSFASEPTFYGIILFFISWLLFNSVRKIEQNNIQVFSLTFLGYLTILMNIFSIIFISQSATTILLMLIVTLLLISLFLNIRLFKFLFLTILVISIIVIFNFAEISNSRAMSLAMEIYKGGWDSILKLIYQDHSINGRVAQVVIPYIGLIQNFGMPGGYLTFEEISTTIISPESFFHSEWGITLKIQSFIGVFIYELGFLGIVILLIMATLLKKEYFWSWREILILFIALIPSVPLGFGVVPLLFGSKVNNSQKN